MMAHLVLIFILFAISNEIEENANVEIYEVKDFFDEIKSTKISNSDANKIINSLTKILERYVFLDEVKSKYNLDLINELKSINRYNRDLYSFYRDIKKVIDKSKDRHLDINLDRLFNSKISLKSCFFIFPMYFIIKENLVYARPNNEFRQYFDSETMNIIDSHINRPIYKINSEKALKYIQYFNEDFRKYKSEQGQFVQNQHIIPKVNVSCFPFDSLNNNLSLVSIDYGTSDYFYETEYFNYKVIHYLNHSYEINPHIPFLFEDTTYDEKKWDESIEYEGGKLKCRIDPFNRVNVIYQDYFNTEISMTKKFFDKCFSSFDDNSYPIIVIENYNPGGYVALSSYFYNYINLNSPTAFPASLRYNDNVKQNIAKGNTGIEIETCKEQYLEYFFGFDPIEKDGHKRTKEFDFSLTDKKVFYEFREKAKNIRKPHEIIIFTDGFSYSATSIFIKETQLRGGAIIVGFGGNPENNIFDSSLAPSPVTSAYELYSEDQTSKDIIDLGFSFKYPIIEITNSNDIRLYDKALHDIISLEFYSFNIDERVNIYNDYSDSKYQLFIDEAKKIFSKYDTQCNYNNMNLLKISEYCKFDWDKHLHGGYDCGQDRKWNYRLCVPSYCDKGYIFDNKEKKCKKDLCFNHHLTVSIVTLLLFIILIL